MSSRQPNTEITGWICTADCSPKPLASKTKTLTVDPPKTLCLLGCWAAVLQVAVALQLHWQRDADGCAAVSSTKPAERQSSSGNGTGRSQSTTLASCRGSKGEEGSNAALTPPRIAKAGWCSSNATCECSQIRSPNMTQLLQAVMLRAPLCTHYHHCPLTCSFNLKP